MLLKQLKRGCKIRSNEHINSVHIKGIEYIVQDIRGHNFWTYSAVSNCTEFPFKWIDKFDLVSPIDEAKATLEAAGYTITPPKPKLTGWVNIYRITDDNIFSGTIYSSKEVADAADETGYPRIATIQFTEGDGL